MCLAGFGMGLMFNCAYLSVGFYFDKNRPLATALASSGTGKYMYSVQCNFPKSDGKV